MAYSNSADLDRLLRRKELADALNQRGFPTSATTLATKVTRGGGPPYRLYGRVPLYCLADAIAWAEARLSPPLHSSAEADLRRTSPAGSGIAINRIRASGVVEG